MTEFTPASGRNTVNAASRAMNNFIEEVFNQDGSIKDNKYPKSVSKWNCTFCPYKELLSLRVGSQHGFHILLGPHDGPQAYDMFQAQEAHQP